MTRRPTATAYCPRLRLRYGGRALECRSPPSPPTPGWASAPSTGATRSREALLAALTHRSFQRVLEAARLAADSDGTAVDALRSFIDQTIDHGAELVLPLHGGPVPLDPGTQALRTEVHATIEQILSRGRQDGSVRPDVFAFDIVLFGALLAQPLPQVPDWKLMARRQAGIYLDGLAGTASTPLPRRKLRARSVQTQMERLGP